MHDSATATVRPAAAQEVGDDLVDGAPVGREDGSGGAQRRREVVGLRGRRRIAPVEAGGDGDLAAGRGDGQAQAVGRRVAQQRARPAPRPSRRGARSACAAARRRPRRQVRRARRATSLRAPTARRAGPRWSCRSGAARSRAPRRPARSPGCRAAGAPGEPSRAAARRTEMPRRSATRRVVSVTMRSASGSLSKDAPVTRATVAAVRSSWVVPRPPEVTSSVGLPSSEKGEIVAQDVGVVGREHDVGDAKPAARQRRAQIVAVAVAGAAVEQLAAGEQHGRRGPASSAAAGQTQVVARLDEVLHAGDEREGDHDRDGRHLDPAAPTTGGRAAT